MPGPWWRMATCTVSYIALDGVPRYRSMARQASSLTEVEGCPWRGFWRWSSPLQESPWVVLPKVACWSSLTKAADVLRSSRCMLAPDQRLSMLSVGQPKELLPESSESPERAQSRAISLGDPERSGCSSSSVSCCPDGPKYGEEDGEYCSRLIRTIVSACKAMHQPQHSHHRSDSDLLFGICTGIEGHL